MAAFFVFFVNRGYLVPIDYGVTASSVQHLQTLVQETTGVHAADQVLLTSVGVQMEQEKRVYDYGEIGTKSRPVFLFSRSFKNDTHESSITQDQTDMQNKIKEVMEEGKRIKASQETANIFLRLPDYARSCVTIWDTTIQTLARIVEEHQFIHQGWTALVQNCEDTLTRVEKRAKRHEGRVQKLSELQEKATEQIEGFDESLELMRKITLPPSLVPPKSENDITLYDFLSMTDPNHSLNELVEQVQTQLALVVKMGHPNVHSDLSTLREKSESLEIRGMNKRVQQLEYSLSQLVDVNGTKIAEHSQVITQTPPRLDEHFLRDLVTDHIGRINQIHENLKLLCQNIELFFKSKGEVLTNVRTRLGTWVVSIYEGLHKYHVDIVMFEEKFIGLKQRLDLVRQVKETPLMFATCITEVMRRTQFQKEFRQWHALHRERCMTFNTDENQLRMVFANKLEKHFLRCFFQGMFDKLPVFFVKHVQDFDIDLPEINIEYYKQLRKQVGRIGHLEGVLQVTSPEVFSRLSLRSPLHPSTSTLTMRREESFISYDQGANVTNLNKAFPSTNWLGDEGMDMSPSGKPPLLMAQSPQTTFVPGNRLPSLHDINEALGETRYPIGSFKSDPIQIPSSARNKEHQQQQIAEERSSQFSTPDDDVVFKNDENQFAVDDISTRSQVLEVLRPVASELVALKQNLADTKAELFVYRDRFDLDMRDTMTNTKTAFTEYLDTRDKERLRQIAALQDTIKKMLHDANETSVKITEIEEELHKKNQEVDEIKKEVADRDDTINKLKEELSAVDGKVKEATDDVFKKLTIENEIALDRTRTDFAEELEEKDEKIRGLQKEIEKKNHDIEKLKLGPNTPEFKKMMVGDVRSELEKEFKNRVDLITKGLEEKKDHMIARMKKDFEFEQRKIAQEHELSLRMLTLERDLLRDALDDPNAAIKGTDAIAEHVQKVSDAQSEEKHLSPYVVTSPKPSPRKLQSSLDMTVSMIQSPEPSTSPDIPSVPKVIEPGQLSPHITPESIIENTILRRPELKDEGDSDSSVKKESDSSAEDGDRKTTRGKSIEVKDDETTMMDESFMPGLKEVGSQDKMAQSTWTAVSSEPPEETGTTDGGMRTIKTQTRMQMRAMEYMVCLNDIREGATVLVVWDERHCSYILFCISNYIHFVKETSVRRLGLPMREDEGGSRKNWVLAKVQHVDLCVIKKPTNRYKLPMDTRVYRVDVTAFSFEPYFKSSSSPSSQ